MKGFFRKIDSTKAPCTVCQRLKSLMGSIRFFFESLNSQVVNYLTSPTDRTDQLARRMLLAQMLDKVLD